MKKKRLITFVLLSILLIRFFKLMPPVKELFQKSYNDEALEKVYYSSQYILENPKGSIPDDTIYNFTAGYYLRGGSPILVNPEQPPLGKYLLALSILLFQNTIIMFPQSQKVKMTLAGSMVVQKRYQKNMQCSLLCISMVSCGVVWDIQLLIKPL